MKLELRARSLDLSSPVVMGVLNVTPDSFSDGGRFSTTDAAVSQALKMVADGAEVIDIGGESTRPGAHSVSADEQLSRVLPVLRHVRDSTDVLISVDTSDPVVMRECADAGADMINDVNDLRRDGAVEAAAASQAAICIMHMQGMPATMQQRPSYTDVVADVAEFFAERLSACESAGIRRERLTLDPGFGFGKTDGHNLRLLACLSDLAALKCPLTVGWSRKSTLGKLTGRSVNEREAAGIAAALLAVERGARIVRTHDVPGMVDALRIARAVAEAGGDASAGLRAVN